MFFFEDSALQEQPCAPLKLYAILIYKSHIMWVIWKLPAFEGSSYHQYYKGGVFKVNCNIAVFEGKWNVIIFQVLDGKEANIPCFHIKRGAIITHFVANLETCHECAFLGGYAQISTILHTGGERFLGTPNLLI